MTSGPQVGGGSAPVRSSGRDADQEARVERRLRRLGSICAIPAAAALVAAGAMAWVLARDVAATSGASPPAASFLLAFGAMLLILLSRPLRANILRRADERELDADADDGDGAGDLAGAVERGDGAGLVAPAATPAQTEMEAILAGAAPRLDAGQQWDDAASRRLDAFTWATLAGFAMLGAATAIGIWVAVAGSAVFYGLVICVAGLLAMAATWPRRSDLPAQADGRREDGT